MNESCSECPCWSYSRHHKGQLQNTYFS